MKSADKKYTEDLVNDSPETTVQASGAELEDVMRKYDKESNTRIWQGTAAIVIKVIMVAFSLYCMWSTLFSNDALERRLTMFIGLIMIMGFLTYPASKKHVKPNYMPFYDIIIMVLGAGSYLYYYFSYNDIVWQLTSASKMTTTFLIVGIIGVLALAELCRRCVGIPILCVAGVIILYTFLSGTSLNRVIYILFFSTGGILTTPIQVCARYIAVFIIFGAFLERTGISNFFISVANALVGRFSGGPAKVAVISSALCGMVSGSSVGNTVTTGSVTIPMMKKTGYKPEFAGAVEAASSTGGQIMPPIMGAAAFLMAEYMGVTYASVALKAIVPAVLYFAGIFIAVHLEAKKTNLRGIPKEDLPRMSHLIKKIYLLIPLVILIWLVTGGVYTMQKAATLSIGAAILIGILDYFVDKAAGESNNMSVWTIIDALEAGGKGTITVAVACCMAGIIAGCITATGLASKLISGIVNFSNSVPFINPLFIALFLTMLCCIVLGMGVPTTANYCIMASTCAPILIKMGLPVMVSHFFVFYFGIVADITPPVALAAYAGSAIAKAKPMRTAINASTLAIGAFIVPYCFAFNPALLFIDCTPSEGIIAVATALVGIFGVAAALRGYCFNHMNTVSRVFLAIGGLMLIYPETVTDIIGLVAVAGFSILQIIMKKRHSVSAASAE